MRDIHLKTEKVKLKGAMPLQSLCGVLLSLSVATNPVGG